LAAITLGPLRPEVKGSGTTPTRALARGSLAPVKNTAIPDALEMTRLKYGREVDVAEKDRVAARLREADRFAEASLLYDGRPNDPALAADLDRAVRAGAAFHLFSLRRMGVPVDEAHFRACAAAAEAKGRWYDAHRCWTAVGDAEALARIAPNLPGFKTAVPSNKA
jgi:hypothetical protein